MIDDESAAIERRVASALDALGVPYEVVRIDPDFADTAAFCERYGVSLERSANTIVVGSKKEPRQFAACVVLATTRLDVNHAVRSLRGVARLSFAGGEDTRRLTGMMIGGVTPFALPDGLPIYVDAKVMEPEWLIVGGGSRSTKIKTIPEVFRRLPGAVIVPGLAQ